MDTKAAAADASRELSLTRIIDAPRELVFKVWTDTETFSDWWGPHGMTTPICEMDLRPGGTFRTLMRMPDGTEYPNLGVFLEVVEPERIVCTDAFEPGWKPSSQAFMGAVTTFEDIGDGKTRYTAKALHWSEEDRKKHEEMGFHDGWGQSADRFVALVARVKDQQK